jgi:hypothetical protein
LSIPEISDEELTVCVCSWSSEAEIVIDPSLDRLDEEDVPTLNTFEEAAC